MLSGTQFPREQPTLRSRLRLIFVATITTVPLLMGPAGTATADEAAHHSYQSAEHAQVTSSIVGDWRGDVLLDDGSIERNVTLHFSSDGQVTTEGGVGVGTGTWRRLRANAYTYTTTTPTDFGSLTVTGYVAVRGNSFAGYGEASAFDKDGNLLGSGQSLIYAKRQ